MTKYLITPTLLNSFKYYQNDQWKEPAESRLDFLKTLSRERFAPNEAMQKGIDFENDINAICNGDITNTDNFKEPHFGIAKIVKGGLWQQSVKKEITIGSNDFILYGRTDVIKGNTIYDIKYTKNYDLGKFTGSSQHRIYLYCTDMPEFKYLVSNGDQYWVETYFNNSNIEDEIKSMISDVMGYFDNDQEAKKLFLTKWESK